VEGVSEVGQLPRPRTGVGTRQARIVVQISELSWHRHSDYMKIAGRCRQNCSGWKGKGDEMEM
jgi:hypothetical protein